MNIKTTLRNYGKISDITKSIGSIRILLLKGPNGSGKTTIRTAFNEAASGKAIKTNPLKQGEESGEWIFEFMDKNNEVITVTHTFNKFNPVGEFTIKDKNGKTYSSRQKLVSIMGDYDPISIDDIWNKTRSIPGTREFIRDFILPRMDKKSKEAIEELNKQLKEGTGELYVERTIANKELKNTKAVLESFVPITESEQKDLEKYDKTVVALTGLKAKESENSEIIKLNNSLKEEIKELEVSYSTTSIILEAEVNNLNLEIKELQEKLKAKLDLLTEKKDKVTTDFLNHEKKVNQLKESIVEIPGLETLIANIERGESFLQSMKVVKEKQDKIIALKDDIRLKESNVTQAEKAINTAKAKKAEVLKNSTLPKGLSFDDEQGIITFDGLPFTKTEISESEAKLCIAELKCTVEPDSFLLDMGDYRTYGEEKMKEINALAEKFGKIVIMESVDDDLEEVTYINVIVDDENPL